MVEEAGRVRPSMTQHRWDAAGRCILPRMQFCPRQTACEGLRAALDVLRVAIASDRLVPCARTTRNQRSDVPAETRGCARLCDVGRWWGVDSGGG